MGILDFVKDVGLKLFETDAEAADNIKQHLEIKTSGLSDLEVDFDDGVATVKGKAINQATKDLAVAIAGNVKGVERVDADGLAVPPPPPEAPEPEPAAEYYEIASGDTLGSIAKRFYGRASAYMKIYEANKDIIENPDRIYPGQKIIIPKD
ncbi:MAG: peptidoglycan-binding protein LysM [Pseudomonadota bacterium]